MKPKPTNDKTKHAGMVGKKTKGIGRKPIEEKRTAVKKTKPKAKTQIKNR